MVGSKAKAWNAVVWQDVRQMAGGWVVDRGGQDDDRGGTRGALLESGSCKRLPALVKIAPAIIR
jgi:hypothetical protein